jgi:hypothetical protein
LGREWGINRDQGLAVQGVFFVGQFFFCVFPTGQEVACPTSWNKGTSLAAGPLYARNLACQFTCASLRRIQAFIQDELGLTSCILFRFFKICSPYCRRLTYQLIAGNDHIFGRKIIKFVLRPI